MPFAHLASVLDVVEPLGARFETAGRRLYLVGGIVRDQWLDQPLAASSDIDLTTDARPEQIKELVADLADALWTQGERFGTIGLRFDGRAIEITTHRAERYDADSRKPEVAFGDDIRTDLSRRDFTVNTLAVLVSDGSLVDPFGGVDDLAEGRLRTPLSPEVSFTDDPLRMLRAARFSARFDLEPDSALVQAATELRARLRIVAIERIGDELERLFGLSDPARGLEFLGMTGLADELLSWGRWDAPPAGRGIGSSEVAADVAAVASADWRARFAAFLLRSIEPSEIAPFLSRVRLSKEDQRAIGDIALAAGRVSALDPDEPGHLRRWYASTRHPDLALAVAAALEPGDRPERIERAIRELDAARQLADPGLLDGAAIMRLLDLDAGPIVGEAVHMLHEAFFDDGPMSADRQEALLQTWYRDLTS